jgi:hypothetical protein
MHFKNVTLSIHNETLLVLDLVMCLTERVSCLLARAAPQNPNIQRNSVRLETDLTGGSQLAQYNFFQHNKIIFLKIFLVVLLF